MRFPVTAVPTSLFLEDGTMRKTSKAELVHCLESILPVPKTKDDRSKNVQNYDVKDYVYIRDAMAELHQLHINCKTFVDLAYKYMKQLLQSFCKADVVVDVFDQYDKDNSVKGEERDRCQKSVSGAREYHVMPGRLLPRLNSLNCFMLQRYVFYLAQRSLSFHNKDSTKILYISF